MARSQAPQGVLGSLRSRVIQGAHVIDFGCGRGELAQAIAQSGARSVVGIDLSPESIADARAKLDSGEISDRVTFMEGLPKSIPLPDASIDTILCFDVMEHVIEYEAIVPQWRRVLAPRGRVFIKWMPWAHPHGHHCYPLINIPWAHLFVSEGTILRAAARVYDSPAYQRQEMPFWHRAEDGGMRANPFAGQTTLTDYLNRLSTRKLEAVCKKAGLVVARKEAIPFSGSRARVIKRGLAALPYVSDAFCSAVAYDLIAA